MSSSWRRAGSSSWTRTWRSTTSRQSMGSSLDWQRRKTVQSAPCRFRQISFIKPSCGLKVVNGVLLLHRIEWQDSPEQVRKNGKTYLGKQRQMKTSLPMINLQLHFLVEVIWEGAVLVGQEASISDYQDAQRVFKSPYYLKVLVRLPFHA